MKEQGGYSTTYKTRSIVYNSSRDFIGRIFYRKNMITMEKGTEQIQQDVAWDGSYRRALIGWVCLPLNRIGCCVI